MKRTAIALLSLSAILLAGCGAKPEAVVENYFRALEKGEITTAKTYFAQSTKDQVGDSKLTAIVTDQVKAVKRCGGVKSVSVTLTGEGELRTGSQEVVFNKPEVCPTNKDKISVVKEKDGWKLAL